METAEKNKSDIAKLLIAAGADVNAKTDEGKTALIIAAEKMDRNSMIFNILIEAGADLNAKDKSGRTALGWAKYNAKKYGITDVKKVLKAAGAKE